ncbi:MAG TPA: hypothetical protein PKD54_00125 [Pirellulaceae bacterium]|nr:hypothetical protein [Pirellulaceae bacterium]
MNRRSRSIVLFLGIASISAFCGCQQISSFGDKRLPLKEETTSTAPMYRVEMMNPMGGAVVHTGKIADAATVQGALSESGALRRYRSMSIDLYRFVPDKRTVLKLPIDLQPGKRAVRIEQDYALMPGDRIVVRGKNMFGNNDPSGQ